MHADVITQLKVHFCRLKSLIFSDIWWKCFWVNFDKEQGYFIGAPEESRKPEARMTLRGRVPKAIYPNAVLAEHARTVRAIGPNA
jgi:hypothetical protein